MKKVISTSILATCALGASAQLIIGEDYWGGDPTHSAYDQDVIGDADVFDITGFSFVTTPDDLTIRIHGNYFDDIMNNTGLLQTFMGDLFISTDGLSWDTGGSATLGDYFGSGTETTWEYAVAIAPRTNAGGLLADFADGTNPNASEARNADVYAVNDANIQTSSIAISGVYREHQEVWYDNDGENALSTGASWYISDDYSFLGITLDDPDVLFGNSDTIGFHWTMSCGNDVIEFEYLTVNAVPEPAHIGALGVMALLGLMAVRRRLRARRR